MLTELQHSANNVAYYYLKHLLLYKQYTISTYFLSRQYTVYIAQYPPSIPLQTQPVALPLPLLIPHSDMFKHPST